MLTPTNSEKEENINQIDQSISSNSTERALLPSENFETPKSTTDIESTITEKKIENNNETTSEVKSETNPKVPSEYPKRIIILDGKKPKMNRHPLTPTFGPPLHPIHEGDKGLIPPHYMGVYPKVVPYYPPDYQKYPHGYPEYHNPYYSYYPHVPVEYDEKFYEHQKQATYHDPTATIDINNVNNNSDRTDSSNRTPFDNTNETKTNEMIYSQNPYLYHYNQIYSHQDPAYSNNTITDNTEQNNINQKVNNVDTQNKPVHSYNEVNSSEMAQKMEPSQIIEQRIVNIPPSEQLKLSSNTVNIPPKFSVKKITVDYSTKSVPRALTTSALVNNKTSNIKYLRKELGTNWKYFRSNVQNTEEKHPHFQVDGYYINNNEIQKAGQVKDPRKEVKHSSIYLGNVTHLIFKKPHFVDDEHSVEKENKLWILLSSLPSLADELYLTNLLSSYGKVSKSNYYLPTSAKNDGVFALLYKKFEDFKRAENDLKSKYQLKLFDQTIQYTFTNSEYIIQKKVNSRIIQPTTPIRSTSSTQLSTVSPVINIKTSSNNVNNETIVNIPKVNTSQPTSVQTKSPDDMDVDETEPTPISFSSSHPTPPPPFSHPNNPPPPSTPPPPPKPFVNTRNPSDYPVRENESQFSYYPPLPAHPPPPPPSKYDPPLPSHHPPPPPPLHSSKYDPPPHLQKAGYRYGGPPGYWGPNPPSHPHGPPPPLHSSKYDPPPPPPHSKYDPPPPNYPPPEWDPYYAKRGDRYWEKRKGDMSPPDYPPFGPPSRDWRKFRYYREEFDPLYPPPSHPSHSSHPSHGPPPPSRKPWPPVHPPPADDRNYRAPSGAAPPNSILEKANPEFTRSKYHFRRDEKALTNTVVPKLDVPLSGEDLVQAVYSILVKDIEATVINDCFFSIVQSTISDTIKNWKHESEMKQKKEVIL